MRGTWTKALAVAAFVAAAGGYAFEPKKSKTRVSANGVFGIRVLELKEDSCRVEAVREQEVAWTLEKCVGGADDLFFIADDGKRFWVVYPLPEIPPAPTSSHARRRKKPRPSELDAVVAAEYDAKGSPLQVKHLGDFMGEESVGDLRELGKHFKWLGGVLSVPGKPPRLNDAGEVEFETVSGQTYKLKF